MKKLILVFATFVFITLFAAATSSSALKITNLKYKACIDACNASISSCNKMQISCTKMKDHKMDKCVQLSKECVYSCTASVKLMMMDSKSAKAICLECAKICARCATECE